MIATVIVSMLCFQLLCFGGLFLLIGARLQSRKMGMDAFAAGSFLLGVSYLLQLLEGAPGWSFMSVVNHTLTLCVPAAFWVGGMRFFGRPVPLWRPLWGLALAYSMLQAVVQWLVGPEARYALLSGLSALAFLTMALTIGYGVKTFAKDLRVEMTLFALVIAGLCVFNTVKFLNVLEGGLQALDMDRGFQMAFYIYMSFLATVLAPSIIWLILRRLTDELRATAAHDPLTQLLNRRGLVDGLEAHFRSRTAGPAHLLLLDIDHFKRINDTHGHKAGDAVLRAVADLVRCALRQGDLACRAGGEEFVVIFFDADTQGALVVAERLREAVESHAVAHDGAREPLRCTVTVGVSHPFGTAEGIDLALQQADAALYCGKAAGRNRVEMGAAQPLAGAAAF
jgi:diguanylate cyclase (GGDEF)-like protein